jgi:hypothetical protein
VAIVETMAEKPVFLVGSYGPIEALEALASAVDGRLSRRGDGYLIGGSGAASSGGLYRVPGTVSAPELENFSKLLDASERITVIGGDTLARVATDTLDALLSFVATPFFRVDLVLLSGAEFAEVAVSQESSSRVGASRGKTLAVLYIRGAPGEFEVGQEVRIPKSAVTESGAVAQTDYEVVDATSRVTLGVVPSGAGVILEGDVSVRRVVSFDPATTEVSSWAFFRPAGLGDYVKLGELSTQDARVFLGFDGSGPVAGFNGQNTRLSLAARVYRVRNDGQAIAAAPAPAAPVASADAPPAPDPTRGGLLMPVVPPPIDARPLPRPDLFDPFEAVIPPSPSVSQG